MLKQVITHVLGVLRRPLLPSLLLTFLASFFYLYCKDPVGAGYGYRTALAAWVKRVRSSSFFRRLLLLGLYTSVVLFSTLLDRGHISNPLVSIMGGWRLWLTTASGSRVLVMNSIENVAMLMPFTFLLLWTYGERLPYAASAVKVVLGSTGVAFVFSFSIEALQLVLHLGTWQLSDIVYNTLGGAIGGALWYVACRMGRPKPGRRSGKAGRRRSHYPR